VEISLQRSIESAGRYSRSGDRRRGPLARVLERGVGRIATAAERVGPDVSFGWADDFVYSRREHRHDGERGEVRECSPNYGEVKS